MLHRSLTGFILASLLLPYLVQAHVSSGKPDQHGPNQLPRLDRVKAFVGTNTRLSDKERKGTQLAKTWRDKSDKPQLVNNGKLIYRYGAAMPSIVCAPLHVCDIELQPGETVKDVHIGDATRWSITPAVTGSAPETTHLIVKPNEIGLETTLFIATDRRPYHIKLKSHSSQYMPFVGFTYPEVQQQQWAAYRARQRQAEKRITLPDTQERITDLDFRYHIEGQAPWKPLRVYNDGIRTIIQMPAAMAQTEAPALLILQDDQEQLVNYRIHGDRYIVDLLFSKAILIAGVGRTQTKITVTRGVKAHEEPHVMDGIDA